ncbi:MAG: cation diffusion facilitator family transporter, partial [Proteobacteria bacterium]|nr:cation diffusion facilitator family transporter [Pseudomonadota bacterium]
MKLATIASVLVAIFLNIIKLIAYTLTGSVAILSSLLDSFLDLLASIINLIAVRHALEPADAEHRFGHGKAEALAGFSQAGFIIASSGFLLFEAILRLKNPQALEHAELAITVIFISIVMTFLLVSFQRYVVKRTGSIAIQADSIHYLSDFLLNIAVIIALIIVSKFNLNWIDPVFAICIAIYILITARKILLHSIDQLMDRELAEEERDKIRNIVLNHEQVIDLHELRTRLSGRDIFIQFLLDMDASINLMQAHKIADEVRDRLLREFPGAD